MFGLLFGSGGGVSILVIASCKISPAVLSQIKISSEMNCSSIGICGCCATVTQLKFSVPVSSVFVSSSPTLCQAILTYNVVAKLFRKDDLCDGMRLLVLI